MKKLLLLLLSIPSACVYHTQTTDIPLISEKNDLRIDAGISLTANAYGTISYGLTDKLALQAYGGGGSDEKYYFQLAGGSYKTYLNNWVREFYGGFGYGHGNAYNSAGPGNLSGNYQLYFFQANYGKLSGKNSNIEFGFSLKTGYLYTDLTDNNYYHNRETFPVNYHDHSFLAEPLGVLRMGGEHLRFSVKLGGTYIYKFTHPDKRLPYGYYNFGIGLNYRF